MKTKIKLNNIEYFGYHGVSDEEKILGQIFQINIEILFNSDINKGDLLKHSIDYTSIYKDIKRIFYNKKYNLIEHLGSKIVQELCDNYELLYCKVNIKKPNAPIDGIFDSVEVEIEKNV